MPTREPARARLSAWFARRWPLLAVVLAALALQMPLVLAPVGGFHSYNEGFYALGARAQAAGSLLQTLVRPQDLSNMPLFSWILTALVKVAGAAPWIIRSISVAASLAAVYLAGVLSERLVHPRAAVPAAAFAALAPGRLLVGANAQPDMLMVALSMGGLAAYLEAYRRARPQGAGSADGAAAAAVAGPAAAAETRWRLISGVLFGLSVLTKLNGVLVPGAVAVWETVRRRELRWAWRPSARLWWALSAGIPAAWLLLQLAVRGGAFMSSQQHIFSAVGMLDGEFMAAFPNEVLFQLTPPLALAAAAGVFLAARRRTSGRTLMLWLTGITAAAFVFYHFHAYYLLTSIVALSMLAALPVASAEPRSGGWLAFGLILALSLPFTFQAYQQKTAGGGLRTATTWMASRASGPVDVVLPKLASDNSGKVFQYYLPSARLSMQWPDERSMEGTRTFVVFYFTDPSRLPNGSWVDAQGVNAFPVLFGRAMVFQAESIHWFKKRGLGWEPAGPWWWFGWFRVSVPDLKVVDLGALSPEQVREFRTAWHRFEVVGPGP